MIVMVEVPPPGAGIGLGLKLTVVPGGIPDADKVTALLKAPRSVLSTVVFPADPCATVTVGGEAVSMKSDGVTVRVTMAVCWTPPPGAGIGLGLKRAVAMSVGSSSPTGKYPITVTGNGGGVQQTAIVTLTVTPSDFILTASPPTVTVAQGSAGNTTVESTLLGAFNSAVTLSASGMPPGTTVSFNPNPIPAP